MSILISGPLPAHHDTMRWQKHRKENNLDFSHSVFKVRITRVDTLPLVGRRGWSVVHLVIEQKDVIRDSKMIYVWFTGSGLGVVIG